MTRQGSWISGRESSVFRLLTRACVYFDTRTRRGRLRRGGRRMVIPTMVEDLGHDPGNVVPKIRARDT